MCGKTEPEVGIGFLLPLNWRKMWTRRLDLIRLCRALGFGEPKEDTGTNNSNVASLQHVLGVYEDQLATLLKSSSPLEARRKARDYMQAFEFAGKQLGKPRFKEGSWVYCGLKENEEVVPPELRGDFCGKVVHYECAGVCTVTSKQERVACMWCLSEKRNRPRGPPCEQLVEKLTLRSDGAPRILGVEEGDVIGCLFLACECKQAKGSGLPCPAMVAVADSLGCVLDFRLFHCHFYSHHVIGTVEAEAVVERNRRLKLDVKAVLNFKGNKTAPSSVSVPVEPISVWHGDGSLPCEPVVTESAPGGRKLGALGSEDRGKRKKGEVDRKKRKGVDKKRVEKVREEEGRGGEEEQRRRERDSLEDGELRVPDEKKRKGSEQKVEGSVGLEGIRSPGAHVKIRRSRRYKPRRKKK